MEQIKQKKSFFSHFHWSESNDDEEKMTWKGVALLIAVAYIFNCLTRFAWIILTKDATAFFWDGQLMTNTHDGLYWGSILQKALFGWHNGNVLLSESITSALPFFSYLLVKIFSLKLETVMLYFPVFAAGLLSIPMLLIGRLFKNSWWGFCAAILTGTGIGFYSRSLAGYFDTDVFALTILLFALYLLLAGTKTKKLTYALWTAVLIVAAPFFYSNLQAMIYGLVICYIGYNIIWNRRESFIWPHIILITCAFWSNRFWAGLYINGNYAGQIAQLLFVGLIFYILLKTQSDERHKKIILYSAIISIVLFTVLNSPAQNNIRYTITHYFNRQAETAQQTLYFEPVIKTISEAQTVKLPALAERSIGSLAAFILGLLGYLLLIIKKPLFLIASPLVALGFFSMLGGSRFAIFIGPILALGIIYLTFETLSLIMKNNGWREKRLIILLLALIFTIVLLYPNAQYIKKYIPGPVLLSDRVQTLTQLGSIAKPTDYVVSWWDYGSSVWFYSGLNTVASPSAQDNSTLYLLSRILSTANPLETANLSRWAVERFVLALEAYFMPGSWEGRHPVEFLTSAETKEFRLPTKTRDIYLFLPIDILSIYYPIATYSNLDITTGKPLREINFFASNNYEQKGTIVSIPSQGIEIDFNKLTLRLANQKMVATKVFHVVYYDKEGKLHAENMVKNPNADMHVIMMRDQHFVLIMDDKMFNSSLIQMLVFENYDAKLFEPTILAPSAKIYKLKI